MDGASTQVCLLIFLLRKSGPITILAGENTIDSWAKIVDCGDVPMIYLDNTVALKQLGEGHRVGSLTYF